MYTSKTTALLLEKTCDKKYINYLGKMQHPEYVIEYIASYYLLILKKINHLGLLQFFEQDGHSFEPYTSPCVYPHSLNPDIEAWELFLHSLYYCYSIKNFKHNKNLFLIYNYFNNLNFKIEEIKEIKFCEYCKISCLTKTGHCSNCQSHVEQYENFYYIHEDMKKNILKNEKYLYQNLNTFNNYIIEFVYYNLKDKYDLKYLYQTFQISKKSNEF